MRHAFLGARYDDASVAAFLEDCGIKHERCGTAEEMCDKVAQLLADGAVVGWSQGRFEWGPRALGARSILADPRRARMRDRVNQKIKFREAFRPFAPAVLPEDLPRWFVVPEGREEHLTPFMLCVLPATTEGREIIPSVIHADGTARVQRVERAHNELFYDLLVAFKRLTGVGVLLNTSFNLKDEPIVSSPAEAYATFARSDLDHLVLGLHIVSKDGVPTPEESYE
jgi:carbamoyltransferase